jgi:hypothetical protein
VAERTITCNSSPMDLDWPGPVSVTVHCLPMQEILLTSDKGPGSYLGAGIACIHLHAALRQHVGANGRRHPHAWLLPRPRLGRHVVILLRGHRQRHQMLPVHALGTQSQAPSLFPSWTTQNTPAPISHLSAWGWHKLT